MQTLYEKMTPGQAYNACANAMTKGEKMVFGDRPCSIARKNDITRRKKQAAKKKQREDKQKELGVKKKKKKSKVK